MARRSYLTNLTDEDLRSLLYDGFYSPVAEDLPLTLLFDQLVSEVDRAGLERLLTECREFDDLFGEKDRG